eukprot:9112843-Alexandrium_andersonii.AAC.1
MDASGWVDLDDLCEAMLRNERERGYRPDCQKGVFDKDWIIWSVMADAKMGGAAHKQRFEFAG